MTDVDEDVIVEPEEDAEGATQKLKKIREERDRARKEAQENLIGWQRTKADYANLAKRARDAGEQAANIGIIALARSIVSVFDSLEAATIAAAEAPESVQKGLSHVVTQLESALKEHGITRFTPKHGDLFDPALHEPMQTLATDVKEEDNTVADVFQSGYRKGDMIIRPARVAVKKSD